MLPCSARTNVQHMEKEKVVCFFDFGGVLSVVLFCFSFQIGPSHIVLFQETLV